MESDFSSYILHKLKKSTERKVDMNLISPSNSEDYYTKPDLKLIVAEIWTHPMFPVGSAVKAIQLA